MTTRAAAPVITSIAKNIEREGNVTLPAELTDAERFELSQDYFFSEDNLERIK